MILEVVVHRESQTLMQDDPMKIHVNTINVSLIIGQDRQTPLKVPLDKGDLGGYTLK